MKQISYLAALLLTFSNQFAEAEQNPHQGMTVSAGVSVTQGLGVDIGYKLSEQSRLRISMYAWNYERTETVNDIFYEAELQVVHPGIFYDYRPFSTQEDGLRLSAGIIINSNDWTGDARPISNTFTINNIVYNSDDVGNLRGEVDFPALAPYLGIGYDLRFNKEWALTSDLGVIYQGDVDVHLSADGSLTSTPAFQTALREEERNILENDDIEKTKLWPVLKIALEYRF